MMLLLASLSSCLASPPEPPPPPDYRNVQVLVPLCNPEICQGSYALRDGGSWWYYDFTYKPSSPFSNDRLPPGGNWSESHLDPPNALRSTLTITVPIYFSPEGRPLSP